MVVFAPVIPVRLLSIGLALVCLAACQSALQWDQSDYIVKEGDTLYAVAWRYGLDYKELALINGLDVEQTIFPGQTLKIKRGYVSPPRQAGAARTKPVNNKPRPSKPKPLPNIHKWKWRWPAQGTLVAKFDTANSIGKGIDIAGALGSPVLAAEGGKVVYAGSGLIHYGRLIIVKHSDQYLTAYGHNQRLLVKEGDDVQRGEIIAHMGLGPDQSAKLHFELRYQGEPIDPLRFLPKR